MEKTTANGGCPSFERFAAFADKYIDGGLTEKEVGELFAHAEHCAECRRYLEMTVKAEEALGMPESVPMPSELHKKIMSSVTKPKSDAVVDCAVVVAATTKANKANITRFISIYK